MSSNVKLNLIYRNNSQHKSITDYLKSIQINITDNFDLTVNLYLLSIDSIEFDKKSVIIDNNNNEHSVHLITNHFSDLVEIKTHIYHNIFLDEKNYILDSCIHFNEKIINISNDLINSYTKLEKNGITYTFLHSYGVSTLLKDNFVSIFHDKLGKYALEKYNITIDDNYLDNYMSPLYYRGLIDIIITKIILGVEFIPDLNELIKLFNSTDNDNSDKVSYLTMLKNQFPHYISFLIYLKMVDDDTMGSINKNLFKNQSNSYSTIQYYHELEIVINNDYNVPNLIDVLHKLKNKLKIG